nr:probable membrane protein Q0155 - yeast (Saccharomyces cerevisiae) mitochondrion [Saccharomyces cerevisiae]
MYKLMYYIMFLYNMLLIIILIFYSIVGVPIIIFNNNYYWDPDIFLFIIYYFIKFIIIFNLYLYYMINYIVYTPSGFGPPSISMEYREGSTTPSGSPPGRGPRRSINLNNLFNEIINYK